MLVAAEAELGCRQEPGARARSPASARLCFLPGSALSRSRARLCTSHFTVRPGHLHQAGCLRWEFKMMTVHLLPFYLKGRERPSICQFALPRPNVRNHQCWVREKLGTWNSSQVPHVEGVGTKSCGLSHYLPPSLLWIVNRREVLS